MTRFVDSADGVKIAFAVMGEKEPALVFVHGGLADRTFWSNQTDVFSANHKVIALRPSRETARRRIPDRSPMSRRRFAGSPRIGLWPGVGKAPL